MCIKIVKPGTSFEFEPKLPLERQLHNAKEILVNYDPSENDKIEAFMDQIEEIVKKGISCPVDIKVNANNSLKGFRLERALNKISENLMINEAIKALVRTQTHVDQKLSELSNMCLGKENGQ